MDRRDAGTRGTRDEPPSRVRITECEIRNNYLSHIAIHSDSTEGTRIEGNLLHGTAFFAIRPGAVNNFISGDAIFDNSRSGLYSVGSSIEVTDNLFFNNGYGGISRLAQVTGGIGLVLRQGFRFFL